MNTAAIIDPPKTHNQSPFDLISQEIEDLFGEAKNFADGAPIANQEMHDAIERLYDGLHDAGKRLEELRVAEKKPLDDQVDAIQKRYNPYVQAKKGKVALGKDALGTLLAAWRTEQARQKAAIAAAKAKEAEEARLAAEKAIRASGGNLEARVEAEEVLAHAKSLERDAKRSDKAATTGLGLRTIWLCEVTDIDAALDHYYPLAAEAFKQLAEELARVDVSMGKREIPGFRVFSEKRAV